MGRKGRAGERTSDNRSWTLEEWNMAHDWRNSHPEGAAAFLRSQGIDKNLDNLTSETLRCVGFTALYELGLIGAAPEVEVTGGTPDHAALIPGMEARLRCLEEMVFSHMRGQHGAEDNSMRVVVKALTGKNYMIDVAPSYTVALVKEIIQRKEGIPPDQQVLIFAGWGMEDEWTLAFYGVQDGGTLHLKLNMCGD